MITIFFYDYIGYNIIFIQRFLTANVFLGWLSGPA